MTRLALPHALILLLPAAGYGTFTRTDTWDFGFIASRHEDVRGNLHDKAVGPFYERVPGDDHPHGWAVRPVASTFENPDLGTSGYDIFWPLAISRDVREEEYRRALIFYSYDHGDDNPPRDRLWLFPFYFQGSDRQGEDYRALFPLYGSIHEFLGRDEISFVLWPLYSTSKLNDLETVNVLWPLISRTTGEDKYRARFFPFYGISRDEGKFDKRFILWPFWNDVTYHYPQSHGSGFVLFPLFGRLNLSTEKTTWVLPPFFRFTSGEERDIIHCPWPFFQWSSGDKEMLYLWPLWGNKKLGGLDRTFVLWPIFWHETDTHPEGETFRFRVWPIYTYYSLLSDPAESGEREKLAQRTKVWPLFSYRRYGEDSLFRFLELWPFRHADAVDRNIAPLWTLYARERSGENVDHEILWGLFRNQKRGDDYRYWSLFPLFDYERDARKEEVQGGWSILKGLIGWERDGERAGLRLLYFLKFGGEQKDDEP